MEGELFTHLRACPKKTKIIGRAIQEQKKWQVAFSSLTSQDKNKAKHETTSALTLTI